MGPSLSRPRMKTVEKSVSTLIDLFRFVDEWWTTWDYHPYRHIRFKCHCAVIFWLISNHASTSSVVTSTDYFSHCDKVTLHSYLPSWFRLRCATFCCRYNGNDGASNMAVVAINMVSGWLPDKNSVHAVILYLPDRHIVALGHWPTCQSPFGSHQLL